MTWNVILVLGYMPSMQDNVLSALIWYSVLSVKNCNFKWWNKVHKSVAAVSSYMSSIPARWRGTRWYEWSWGNSRRAIHTRVIVIDHALYTYFFLINPHGEYEYFYRSARNVEPSNNSSEMPGTRRRHRIIDFFTYFLKII